MTNATSTWRVEDFLVHIAEDPNDDERRLVFADWLLERDDPWGELIALQYAAIRRPEGLTDREDARVAEIHRLHGRAILGPLAPHLDLKSVRFERGMPIAGAFRRGSAPVPFDDPRWATFRALRLLATDDATMAKLLFESKTLRLEALSIYPHTLVALVALGRALDVTSLEISGWGVDSMQPHLETLGRFPRLETLHVSTPSDAARIAAYVTVAPVVQRLRRLRFQLYGWRSVEIVRETTTTTFAFEGLPAIRLESTALATELLRRAAMATHVRVTATKPLEPDVREDLERGARSVGAAFAFELVESTSASGDLLTRSSGS